MPEDDPFKPLIDGFAEILSKIEKNARKDLSGPVDPALEQQVEFLKKTVDSFVQEADEQIRREGKDPQEILKKIPQIYSEREKKWLKKCHDLGVHAFVLRESLTRAAQAEDSKTKRPVSKNTKKSIQKRQGKFKGIGGADTKWKRL